MINVSSLIAAVTPSEPRHALEYSILGLDLCTIYCRAVQSSQASAVRSYHRRLFANWGTVMDGHNRSQEAGSPVYLLWDEIDAPVAECTQATFNLHVLTQLGWPGAASCIHPR